MCRCVCEMENQGDPAVCVAFMSLAVASLGTAAGLGSASQGLALAQVRTTRNGR
jgi:hypothetical protein